MWSAIVGVTAPTGDDMGGIAMTDTRGLQVAALQSTARVDNIVEGHIHSAAFDVQLHRTRWAESGAGVFHPSMCFIEMILTRPLVRASYDRSAGLGQYQLLGDVAFVPRDVPLYCSWAAGNQRSVSCLFDVERLAGARCEWRWPSFDLMKTLAIGNDYVRAGLRRIAEEVLSPGFASTAQIEASLMFVAYELSRLLENAPRQEVHDNHKLSARQLATLRETIFDTPGEGPTIVDLAAQFGMSPRQLGFAFRNTTGDTLRNLFAQGRIERAKNMLGARHALIKQVAFDSGFQSPAAFVAAFRKATGVTPQNYRKRLGIPSMH